MPSPTEEPLRFEERLEAWTERYGHGLPWIFFVCGALMMVNVLLEAGAIEQAIADLSSRSVFLWSLAALVWLALAVQTRGLYPSTDVSKEARNTEVA